jgi:hypothetical protein
VFERYTEKARRVVFFGRFEASQYGSPYIETEHLLLGLMRENPEIAQLLPSGSEESIRKQIDAHTTVREHVSTSVDLPLSNECKRVLAYGAEEAERLEHRHIGPEHLLLGLLREQGCFAPAILRERGLTQDQLRVRFSELSPREVIRRPIRQPAVEFTVSIHGKPRSADRIQERVGILRQLRWYWHKRPWKAQDAVLHRASGAVSLDLSLAADTENFDLQRGGLQKGRCFICEWELSESGTELERKTAYTNGRDWVCTECHDKILQGPEYFSTSHSEIT